MTAPTWPAYSGDVPNKSQTPAVFNANMAAALVHMLTVLPDGANEFGADVIAEAANYLIASSTTSATIGTGAKSLTVDAGKAFQAGQYVIVTDDAAPTTNYMVGQVTSYNSGTGALAFTVPTGGNYGSGTKTAWTVTVSGSIGPAGETYPSFTGNAGKVLAVNSGETDVEFVPHGWQQLGTTGTMSGSGAYSLTSIPATYNDLMLRFDGVSNNGANSMTIELSPGASAWLTAFTLDSNMIDVHEGGIVLFDYLADCGAACGGVSNSPGSMAAATVVASLWACVGGIAEIRIARNAGLWDGGVITLFGRI